MVNIMKKGIVGAAIFVVGVATGALVMNRMVSVTNEEKAVKADRLKSYYGILNQWLKIKHEGKSFADFFERSGYHNVAIYGMGEIGNRLYEELTELENINVLYSIDKKPAKTFSKIEVYGVDQKLPSVDVIIITPIFAIEEIEDAIKENNDYPIISIEDLLFEI